MSTNSSASTSESDYENINENTSNKFIEVDIKNAQDYSKINQLRNKVTKVASSVKSKYRQK